MNLTADEIEMIRKFRALDGRGRNNVLRAIHFEYEETIAAVGEKLSTCNCDWLKDAVFAVGNIKTEKKLTLIN